jgi:gas vesicle protein
MSENRIYYSRSAEMRAKQEQMIAMILFMLLGVAIGTLLALLFTPISGSKARQEIANALEEGFDSGRHASQRAIESLEDQLKELRKRVEDRLG